MLRVSEILNHNPRSFKSSNPDFLWSVSIKGLCILMQKRALAENETKALSTSKGIFTTHISLPHIFGFVILVFSNYIEQSLICPSYITIQIFICHTKAKRESNEETK